MSDGGSGERPAAGSDDDTAWRSYSACLHSDPDLFYPEGAPTNEARAICKGCVVREECLEYALRYGERYGTWGGMSERERKRIRRQRALRLTAQTNQQQEST